MNVVDVVDCEAVAVDDFEIWTEDGRLIYPFLTPLAICLGAMQDDRDNAFALTILLQRYCRNCDNG
jgi:hypothetical protein